MLITQVCEVCKEDQRDPICRRCYNKELLAWLRENICNKSIISYIINRMVGRFPREGYDKKYCLLCQKQSIFVCKHCYFSMLRNILQELNISDRIVNYFSIVFEGDILHSNDEKGGIIH